VTSTVFNQRPSYRPLSRLLGTMPNDYSTLQTLQEDVAKLVNRDNKFNYRMTISVAGGGSTFASTLAATRGASQLLQTAHTLYDRAAIDAYLGSEPPHYVSSDVSKDLADVAWRESFQYAAQSRLPFSQQVCIGVGASSQLGNTDAAAYCSIRIGDTLVQVCVDQFASEERWEQEVSTSEAILRGVEHAMDCWEGQEGSLSHETKADDKMSLQLSETRREEALCQDAAQSILTGHSSATLVFPTTHQALTNVSVLPESTMIFPGSFNPPHHGHVELAQRALDRMPVHKKQASLVLFELSLINVDKPPLEADAVVQRIQQFEQLDMKIDNWGIVLTNAPLFSQKVELLNATSFCIGTDTLVRILDPKYYNDSSEQMMSDIRAMNSTFYVGGRLEQKQKTGEFVTGQEQVDALPADLQERFVLLPNFRVDVSSSELRDRKK